MKPHDIAHTRLPVSQTATGELCAYVRYRTNEAGRANYGKSHALANATCVTFPPHKQGVTGAVSRWSQAQSGHKFHYRPISEQQLSTSKRLLPPAAVMFELQRGTA